MSNTVITLILAVFASGGFWAFIQSWWSSKSKAKTAEQRLLLGIAFRQIIDLCHYYLKRGWIDTDEYKELNHYLFAPYRDLGGDGTAARLIQEVEKLPLKKEGETE